MPKNVTLQDVASAAGVSVSTASRALGGAGRISAATRARVLATAERLEFRPDVLARSFVTGKSFTVGIIAEMAIGRFSMPTLVGANRYFGKHDIATLTVDAHADHEALVEHLKRLRARRVDGLLVIGDSPDLARLTMALKFPAPIVYAYSVPEQGKELVVLPDNHRAGVLAGEHLIGLRRRRIAHITADTAFPAAAQRLAGLREALAGHGLVLAAEPLEGSYSRDWGAEAARRLLASSAAVDAVFAANDEIALGAYAVFSRKGLRVPDDIAIVGYDNLSSDTQGPTLLTSIDPRLSVVGATAAERLLARIAGRPDDGVDLVQPGLVEGRSTQGPTLESHLAMLS